MGGWVDGWVDVKAGLRIAYSNQKQPKLEKGVDRWVEERIKVR